MTTVETQHCYRHPDRETGLSCSDCGRPICADCATFAPVGIRCPEHADQRRRTSPAPVSNAPRQVARAQRRLGATDALVTKILIGINVVVYLLGATQAGASLFNPMPAQVFFDPNSLYHRLWLDAPEVANGGWYRLITAAFLHASVWHIGLNMLALWWIGAPIERYLGRARYLGLYLVAGLAGSAGALIAAPLVPTVGASGAIFGILGAMLIIEYRATGRLGGTAMTLIVINLAFGFAFNGAGGNISIGGHIGGLIGGILITLAYMYGGNRRRVAGRSVDFGAILGLVIVAVASVALAYWKVRGYA
jgi:membrane associated rhomboid family serine protease